MRTVLCMAIGRAPVVSNVPAAFAQDSRVADPGKPAGKPSSLDSRSGISLAVPVGRILVDPGAAGGQPVYVRRMTVRDGMTVVEVSSTPFEAVLASNVAVPGVRPDQPAGW